jgi:hypothetical protein
MVQERLWCSHLNQNLTVKKYQVLISNQCIETVNWADGAITVNVSAKKIRDSPLFDLEQLIDPQYEIHLRKYYEISQDSKFSQDLKDRL